MDAQNFNFGLIFLHEGFSPKFCIFGCNFLDQFVQFVDSANATMPESWIIVVTFSLK